MVQAPTGTVTFLFTDIEGSTRLWEADLPVMREALARHDAIMRDAVDRAGGFVFATGGDGFAVAFSRAGAALAAAADAQRVLQSEQLPPVRMSLHTGEAVERDGDYFGPTVNRAARLMGIAHGGQVLASQATEQVATGVELRDLGEHRLRDLSRSERVFQLVAPGLQTDFPPLRSLDTYAGNLPLQLTSFVGREREVDMVAIALRESRLVTIIGVGGVGKTRLAVQVAAEIISEYRDGVWICELSAAADPEAVAQIVGSALGVSARRDVALDESIVEHLRGTQLLVVLDNCEHVLDTAGDLVDAVLRSCRDVCVLATSREPLARDGERIVPLRSLAVADADAGVDAITATDAVRLFEDRAAAARSGFTVSTSDVRAVAEICRRLDGIPLAIELAAARVVAMSPREIASLLDERFRLLTGGRRGSVERHQTLRATVEWSYALLDDNERAVFERLAVFTGFDAPGARAVVADAELDAWSVLDAIAGLVRKSMLVADEHANGTTRYQMLETLRQYALEALSAHDDVDAWRRRHATYFAQFAEEIGRVLLGPDEFAARLRLYADVDNVRSACTWALDRDDVADEELGVRILAALAEDYAMSSLTGLALPSATRALDAARRSTPGRRAAVLASAAYEAQARFEMETARKLGQEALADGITPDCPTPYRVYFAAASDGQSALPEMIPLLEEAIEELAATGAHTAEQARVCGMLVQASVRAGDFEGAHRYAARALELAEQSGNPSTLAQLLYYIGTSWARDDPDRALSAYAQSIALCREGANYATFGPALFQGALLLARKGERTRALSDLCESIVFQSRSEMRPQLEGALAYAMEIFTVLGAFEEAAVIAGAARGGALTHLGGMAAPPDRRQRGSGPMRDALGPERFSECAAAGAAMSIEELVSWTLAALDRLRSLE